MDELLILEVLLRLLSLLVSCVGCYMLYEVLLRCKDLIQALCKVQWLFQSLHFVTIMVFFPSKKQLDCFTMNWSVPAIFGHFLTTLPAILLSASNGSPFLLSLRLRDSCFVGSAQRTTICFIALPGTNFIFLFLKMKLKCVASQNDAILILKFLGALC
jgi:hypothetical protein